MMHIVDLIAQTAPAQPTSTPQQPPSSAAFLLPAMMIALVVFLLLSSRSQRKREERQRQELHNSLAKNDRVLTIGGVIGTVTAVKDDQVIVKVDESTNTKMTFLKTAIQRIITDDAHTSSDVKGLQP